MSRFTRRSVVAVLVCAALLAPSAGVAHADELGTVPKHAIVGSVDLFGMTAVQAREAIAREASIEKLPPLKVRSAGKDFYLDPAKALTLDVEAMLGRAYAPSLETTFTITRSVVISSEVVARFTNRVARGIQRDKRDARYYVKSGKLKWRRAVWGRALRKRAAASAVTKRLQALALTGQAGPTPTLRYKVLTPKVTNKTLGRAILVDLSRRDLRLYDHSKMLKKYGVAIGMRGYSTPRGAFKVIAKSASPAWRNPGSAWAANMPAYIAPGPTNPLGTRALYINSPGIRIHGTHKTWSIGTAASHGCVRVANRNIEKLYPRVPVGTKVFIIR